MIRKPPDDNYPYENLTDKQTADIARLQDNHIRDLLYENHLLRDELYRLNTWRNKVIPILEANNIDINATTEVMNSTHKVFK
jgi:hypothetical protein